MAKYRHFLHFKERLLRRAIIYIVSLKKAIEGGCFWTKNMNLGGILRSLKSPLAYPISYGWPFWRTNRFLNNLLSVIQVDIKWISSGKNFKSPRDAIVIQGHSIGMHSRTTQLKSVCPRMSLPFAQPVNCIFWPIKTLYWLVGASKLHKDRGTCCTAEWPYTFHSL